MGLINQLDNGFGITIGGGGVPAFSYLIDDISASSNFAWSVIQLNSSVTNCVRLRRSSDNAESDFGFDSNKILDTSAIATWLGAATGYYVTFYDASGNGNNATESVAIRQEVYSSNGGINSLPAIDDSASTYNNLHYPFGSTITEGQQVSYVVVSKTTGTISGEYNFSGGASVYGRLGLDSSRIIFRDSVGFLYSSNTISTSSDNLLSVRRNSSDLITGNINNADTAIGTKATILNPTHLRGTRNSATMDSALMHFSTELGTSDRALIVDWYNTNFNKSI